MSELTDSVDNLKDAVNAMSEDVCQVLTGISNQLCKTNEQLYCLENSLAEGVRDAKV